MALGDKTITQNQKWNINRNNDGTYRISILTVSNVKLFVEAFCSSLNFQLMTKASTSPDQKFYIAPVSLGSTLQRITVDTNSLGWQAIEAFPIASRVQPASISNDVDQEWMICDW